VHANVQALTAVLDDIDRRGADEIYHVGDLVGFGPSPNEVVEVLRRRGIRGVMGNVDEGCLRRGIVKKAESSLSLKQKMCVWTYRQLSPQNRRHLKSLPGQLRLEALGKRVLLVHGSPDSIAEYIDECTGEGRLKELARLAQADVVVAGHSHKPFVAQAGGTLFVNVGSVGRPEGGGSRSCYAMLTIGPAGVRVKHYKPRYDLAATIQAVRQAGMGAVFERMIRTGQSFKQAEAELSSALPGDKAPVKTAGGVLSADTVPPQVHRLAGAVGGAGHSRHVTHLALSMFDQIAGRLGLKNVHDRMLLECACLLHDIGWALGQAGHHKESMRMILAEPDIGLVKRDQLVVANIARYHRRALPSLAHANYRRLGESDRQRVRLLGGLLRLADGLDCQHLKRVRQVKLSLTDRRLIVRCQTAGDAAGERVAARHKSDLLEDVLDRRVELEWNPIPA
jgi:putative phosphoesterase